MLGTLQVSVADGRGAHLGGHRQRMVLALLLLHAQQPVSVDALIEGVWGDQPPATARKTLQVYVSRLRQVLDDGAIIGARDGYLLQAVPDQIDAIQFERLAAEGRRLSETDPAAAAAILAEALRLWRGPAWGELAYESALSADASRWHELKLAVAEDHLAAALAAGEAAGLVGELRTLVADHPLRERLRGLLMVALYRLGQTAESLAVFEEGRRLLADELGADPGAELEALHRRVLQQDPSLLAPPRTVPVGRSSTPRENPYQGLNPFDEDDADDFFGRGQLVQELLERTTTSSLVTVVGPSGSGKSSVVRAGLVPALRDTAPEGASRWRIAAMAPGAHPFTQLESALLRAADDPTLTNLESQLRGDDLDMLRAVLRILPEGGRLALVIDAFEELFLQVEDEVERDRFIRNLAEALEDPHSGLTVVATLRADVLHLPMAHPRLGPLLVDGIVHVLPLTPAELGAACVAPAARVGVTVEPELAGELVAEVTDHPGALPLFQYALTELFDHRRDDIMGLQGYRELGEVSGVVARRAEETYASLDRSGQEACRQVFLRLVALGPEGEAGRRRAARSELDSLTDDLGAVKAVLDRFAAARLLAFDRDEISGSSAVEVAHEALLRAWPRLEGWIEESRDDLRVQRSVAVAARDWEAAGRDEDYLLSGMRLELAAAWCGQTSVAPTASEHAYVEASLARRELQQAEEQARQQRELQLERRATGRLRQLVAVLALATLVAGSLGVVAAVERARSDRQADEARAATELVRARRLANTAVATRRVDPELSLLLALHGANITSQAELPIPNEIYESLHWSLQARRVQFPGDPDPALVTGPEGPQGIFRLPIDELVALARENVARGLTPGECRDLFEDSACPALPAVLPAMTVEPAMSSSVLPEPAVGQPLAGTRVTLVAPFISETAGGLGLEFEAFTKRTGIEVEATAPSDFENTLRNQLQQDRPPDIAFVPQPIAVASLAREGELVDLSGYLDPEVVRAQLSDHLVSLGTVAPDGTWPSDAASIYGLPIRVSNKSTVWYSIPGFEGAGYEIPRTYDELMALTERIVADGRTPWCHGEGSGPASGWLGTDVIENLLLHDSLEDYDAWLRHDIPFDSPPLQEAFQRMSRLLLEPGQVVGGQAAAATLFFQAASAPLFDDPPGCLLYPFGTDAPSFFPLGAEPGRDVGVFPFPPITAGQERLVLGGGDFAIVFTDRPEVRELVRHLASDDFGTRWARVDPTFLSARQDFPVGAYCGPGPDATCVPDPIRATLAPALTESLQRDRFRFDGSDLLTHDMGLWPMWDTMVEFVGEGPDNRERLLAELEATWVERERDAEAASAAP
jgi:DNA-binding SARP family transcriptional activator/ABC-type glycerol-3-phosphate transport system substrate-binding protein